MNVQSLLNGINIATENAGVNQTQALTGGIAIPNTSTEQEADGIGGYVNNSSTTTNGVAVYGRARIPVNGIAGGVWGANFNITNCSMCTGSKMTDLELDMNQNGPDATFAQGLVQDGIDIISAGTNKPRNGIALTATAGANYWQLGMLLANYVTTGLQISNGATGSTALDFIPPDDTSSLEVYARNHANSAYVWTIGNNGAANFLSVGSSVFNSVSSNISATGALRLATGDVIGWRNNVNSADVDLAKNNSDQLTFGGSVLSTAPKVEYCGATSGSTLELREDR